MSAFDRHISRRAALGLGLGTAASLANRAFASADNGSITINCPYLCQGGTGANEGVNCGPTSVAMAVNYSGASHPSVANVRATLGIDGPTDVDQWAWLLDVYGVPWYSVWSLADFMASLRKGHPIVIGTWMGAISRAGDYEVAYAQKSAWQGRYDHFSEGHAMVITGTADGEASFLVHDPNVFPGDATGYYDDGTPKGQYRRYSTAEIWYNVATYGNSLGFAIVPLAQSLQQAQRIVRIKPETDGVFPGPGGGESPRRSTHDLNPESNHTNP